MHKFNAICHWNGLLIFNCTQLICVQELSTPKKDINSYHLMCTVFSRYQPISMHVPNEIYVIDEHLRASCKREKKHRNTNKMVKSWLTHKVIESALKLDRYKDYWQRLLQHYAVPIYAFISKPHTSTQRQWNNRKSFFPVLITSSRGFVRIVIAGYNFHVIAWNFGRVLCVWVFGC